MLLIKKSTVEDTRDDLSRYFPPFIGELRGVLNYMIETYASVKKDPLSPECFDLHPVDLELPDHCIRIPRMYSNECIKIVMHKLIDCAEYNIKIIADDKYKTVHY